MKKFVILLTFIFLLSNLQAQQILKTYSGSDTKHHIGYNIIETSDGNLLLTSLLLKNNSTGLQEALAGIFLVKINYQGDTIWQSDMYSNGQGNLYIRKTFENADGSFTIFSPDYNGLR